MQRASVVKSILMRESILEIFIVLLISSLCWFCVVHFAAPAPLPPPIPFELPPAPLKSREVWILYIGSWGNPSVDGLWVGWNRTSDRWDHQTFNPPNDLPTLQYPLLGAYSSHNKSLLKIHLDMIHKSSIDAIVVPWDGIIVSNGTSSFTDKTLKLLFELAPQYSLAVIPLFTRFDGRNKSTLIADLQYYKSHYLKEPGHYRKQGKPLGIVYDAQELRGSLEVIEATPEMLFMASALSLNDFMGCFEDSYSGFVTYFASDQLSWGSDHGNWQTLSEVARDRGVDFVPTVSPGFNNSLIDRWNRRAERGRACSNYYDDRWQAAINSQPDAIMINSFNDWPIGSAIEPVIETDNYSLYDEIWCGTDPEFFIKKTGEWARAFKDSVQGLSLN